MDVVETIVRWIVHAAIFRAMWATPLPLVLAIGAAAVVAWIVIRRRRARG